MRLQTTLTSSAPSAEVLDLFAVPESAEPLPGGRGAFVAGDLVLSRVEMGDRVDRSWLAPTLARLAVLLDEQPGRGPGSLRIAVPVPARDGSIVVDGWEAHRFEPGTRVVEDVAVIRAAGRLLHARLASHIGTPVGIDLPTLEDLADPADLTDPAPHARRARSLITQTELLRATMPEPPQGPRQVVHASLPGRVLIDASGAPVILQVVAAWDTAARADARCLVQAIVTGRADPADLDAMSLVQKVSVLDVLPDLIGRAQPEELGAYADVLGRSAW